MIAWYRDNSRTIGSQNKRIQGRLSPVANASPREVLPWSMSIWERYTLPFSFESLSARRRRSTGLYVSGTRQPAMTSIAPAQIAIKPLTHRQPSVIPKNPPIMGPSTGPIKGAALKIDMARPRSLALKTSAMTPPALVSGEEPNAAAKNRRMRSP
jgi:hypothetical protein